GYVTALRGTDSTVLWRVYFDQTIFSSPALADLDGNGEKEVIVGSGCYFSPATKGHWVKILNVHTGQVIRTLNADGCMSSSPAVADLDGNGKLDIVVGVSGSFNSPAGPGRLEAWQYDNPTPKWKVAPSSALNGGNTGDVGLMSPVVADIDGNGSLEVLFASTAGGEVTVFRGSDGVQLSCNNCGNAPTQTLYAWAALGSTPAVGDMDGDGDLEVAIGGTHFNRQDSGFLYVWTNLSGFSAAGNQPHFSTPWPMFRQNPLHTGIFAVPELRSASTSLTLLTVKDGPARTYSVDLTDAAEGAIDWTATKDQSWITLGNASGTTPDALEITIDPAGENLGTQTGTVTIDSAFGSVTLNVSLIVVDQVYDV
ncbi:MAG TPA: FG-GAP-like repeat-containing protein, partial [Roseiflexaceae bacterium]|nr:FG-GAP-like repeat-containing protein [Roseiflexaceae bacterium]